MHCDSSKMQSIAAEAVAKCELCCIRIREMVWRSDFTHLQFQMCSMLFIYLLTGLKCETHWHLKEQSHPSALLGKTPCFLKLVQSEFFSSKYCSFHNRFQCIPQSSVRDFLNIAGYGNVFFPMNHCTQEWLINISIFNYDIGKGFTPRENLLLRSALKWVSAHCF